jgi:hypothetical protein
MITVAILVHMAALQVTNAASVLRSVALPRGKDGVVGAVFSPDSKSSRMVAYTVFPKGSPPSLALVFLTRMLMPEVTAFLN